MARERESEIETEKERQREEQRKKEIAGVTRCRAERASAIKNQKRKKTNP